MTDNFLEFRKRLNLKSPCGEHFYFLKKQKASDIAETLALKERRCFFVFVNNQNDYRLQTGNMIRIAIQVLKLIII